MYHFFKDDLYGNKVPVMSIEGKLAADKYLKSHRSLITRVVEVPRNKQSLIMM